MRKIYYNNLLARLLLWRKDYETAMIFGFICTKRKQAQPLSSKAVNHEAIHGIWRLRPSHCLPP